MPKIAADPQQLRDLSRELRQSAGRLAGLGREAVAAAQAAGYPGAAGAEVEAVSFEANMRVHGVETDALAFGTARAADLFEAADGPWFGVPGLLKLANKWRKVGDKAAKIWRNVPHSTNPKDWRRFAKELKRGRSDKAKFWGFNDPRKAISSFGRSRWETLRHPKSTITKFFKEGQRAVKAVGKKGSPILKRLKPLKKFGGKVVGKVLKPLSIINTYRSSKGKSVIAKLTSTVVQTVVTKNPVVWTVDVVTGGQVSDFVDSTVSGAEAALDGDDGRLAQWSEDSRSGENGWAAQKMQGVGDKLSGAGIFNSWDTLAHGQ